MKFVCHKLPNGGVEILSSLPFLSDQDFQHWQQTAAALLAYAAADRPICLITDDERASELPYEDLLETVVEIATPAGDHWRVGFAASATPELFQTIVESPEFHWDAVWLTFFTPLELERLRAGLETIRLEPEPTAEIEVVLPIGDGGGLLWLRPNRPADAIISRLMELAAGGVISDSQ
ncbi:MAG: hypothetical protein NZ585_09695 [Chloracidobacterium sp.]|nr:hypothetical protein [Chloracidobacterium sp.]MDW8216948.1 hypothetical protein [Acidobacteriota bacterium]